jgi:hypothetical protein
MPFGTQLSNCIHRDAKDASTRYDPAKSDSNFPALFCSLQCEKEWIQGCLQNVTLGDVVDIQARAFTGAAMSVSAAAGSQ